MYKVEVVENKRRKKCILYPEDRLKLAWDLIIGILLILTCILIPLHTALYIDDDDSKFFLLFNRVLDCFFAIDIIVTFNTAIQTSQVSFEDNRTKIAIAYLKFWFWVDVIITLPYDIITAQTMTETSNIAYLAKFVRILKIMRLLRMLKLLKLARGRDTVTNLMLTRSTMSAAVERLLLSVAGFFIMCHVIACVWIIQAKLLQSTTEEWISKYVSDTDSHFELYVLSYYFTVTTITTVGYGDVSANGAIERIISVFLMLGGVLAFSFATGSLSTIINSFDETAAQVKEKMQVLKRLVIRYKLDKGIIIKLKNTIKF